MGIIEDLEGAIDMVDLVNRYTKTKKAGANYKALCPFPGHNEKTPSFVVSPSKQIGYCFGCHKGGGPVKFIMDIENCSFKEAIEILGNYTGIKTDTNFNPEKFEAKKNMYSLYKDATHYYKQALQKYPEIKKYLFDRGLTEQTINDFHFGYADSGIELYNYLKKKGYEDQQIADSHIFINTSSKKDKFIGRIIFPIQNARGDFVAFAGRITNKGEPKYLNSPASDIYDKSNILYNLFGARNAINKEDFVIITEGYMDTIALHKGGFLNTVAVSGTALTEKHIKLIKRLTKKIYLCFDGDKAGEKATKLSLEKMKNQELEVKIISLPKGKDPDDIISSGKDFKDFITTALSPIAYYIQQSNTSTESLDDKRNLLKELLEIINSYSDNLEKDGYLKEIAKLLDIKEHVIYDMFNRQAFGRQKSNQTTENLAKTTVSPEEMLLAYCFNDIKNIDFFQQNFAFGNYISGNIEKLFSKQQSFFETLELSQKEKIKGLALQIDIKKAEYSPEKQEEEKQKLIIALNREIFKKQSEKLKQQMNNGDSQALLEYSQLIALAKKIGIK